MKTETGSTRIAYVGKHAIFKFPQIQLELTIREISSAIKDGRLRKYLTIDEKNPKSLANHLSRHRPGRKIALCRSRNCFNRQNS